MEQLAAVNEAWRDPQLYEAQIEKIMENMGPSQGKNWGGQDTENLVRDVVECSLTLMEMAEIE